MMKSPLWKLLKDVLQIGPLHVNLELSKSIYAVTNLLEERRLSETRCFYSYILIKRVLSLTCLSSLLPAHFAR